MLKVTLIKNKGSIQMPEIGAGQSGSITDGLDENASTIIFTCKADDSGAIIHRSTSDKVLEAGMARVVFLDKKEQLELLADLSMGELFETSIKKKFGVLIIRFEHIMTESKKTH